MRSPTLSPAFSAGSPLRSSRIDVETGQLLFNGEGHLADFTTDDPEGSAHLIVHRILARFGSQTGLLGPDVSGSTGSCWKSRGHGSTWSASFAAGFPPRRPGSKSATAFWPATVFRWMRARTDRDAKRLCRVEAGETLQLQVRRADSPMELFVTAEKRPGL